jgi:cell division septal protein FtsQ
VGGRLELARFAPSGRSLLVGLLLLLAALGLYAAARTTALFAVDEIAVSGAPPEVAAEVRRALTLSVGESLLELDLGELERRAASVPAVAAVRLDRAFPHTLAVAVVPEQPVAVLRQGSRSWLVAAGGRVLAELERGGRPRLPRLWLGRDADVRVGERLLGPQRRAVAAVAPLLEAPLPVAVASVSSAPGELVLKLRTGLELRLGDGSDLPAKLEVARRVLPRLTGSELYLDVSVPQRPVAGATLDSQLEVENATSTSASGRD